ncbi:hypothetical protein [Cobetia sp. UCD-24C]|uniref:hypothetical protein n=1 Tax=Cobetia sp. UCD-24C TaxID=1716176 RepID=UPI0009EC15B8|nr:hypothetical protein [Cobetia sp. UCD-24C]
MCKEQKSEINKELDYKIDKLKHLKNRRGSKLRYAKVYFFLMLFFALAGVGVIISGFFDVTFLDVAILPDNLLIFMLCVYALVLFILSLGVKSDATIIDQEIKELEFEIDLQRFERTLLESKAEKTLRVNDIQLQKYYNLNLNHNSWVFKIGIGCLALGVILIVSTLYVVINYVDKLETQFIVATLGAISTFLTSYVAAMFLKIQASASQHLGSFHSRLVDTHQILLASLVASRIADSGLRERTLSNLALSVVSRKNSDTDDA